MPRHKKLEPNTDKIELDAAAKNVQAAKSILIDDDHMKVIYDHLKAAAEAGNPAARTMFGVYHMFIGSNIPERQDEAYAEAIKWFYMNRKGSLENRLLNELTNNTGNLYSSTEDIYKRACNLSMITQGRSIVSLTKDQVAYILSIPIRSFNFSEDTIEKLSNYDCETIGELLSSESLMKNVLHQDQDLLKTIKTHLLTYLPLTHEVRMLV